jgi:hypothetical protein
MAKSEKLYKDSPRVERDKESGEVGITRPSEADAEDMGIDGNPLPGGGDGMPVQVEQMHDRHKKEMSDMHKRHEDEAKDMHKRHQKEVSKSMGKDDEKTGEKKIEKVKEKKED